MLCNYFTHVGMGDTGEGVIRSAINDNLIVFHRIEFVDDRAHMSLRELREIMVSPAFSFVRNPFDFYLSFWIHELKTHRWFGTFHDWFYHREQEFGRSAETEGVNMSYMWHWFTDPGVDYIGRFETLEADFCRIMAMTVPFLTEEEVHTWFPKAYKQWGNRNWIEGIEQWMRDEMYSPQMVEDIFRQDEWFFTEFGYTFAQKYDFTKIKRYPEREV